jgi:hypothetical protein
MSTVPKQSYAQATTTLNVVPEVPPMTELEFESLDAFNRWFTNKKDASQEGSYFSEAEVKVLDDIHEDLATLYVDLKEEFVHSGFFVGDDFNGFTMAVLGAVALDNLDDSLDDSAEEDQEWVDE